MKRLLKTIVTATVAVAAVAVLVGGATSFDGMCASLPFGQADSSESPAQDAVAEGQSTDERATVQSLDSLDEARTPYEPKTALAMIEDGADADALFQQIAALPEFAGVSLSRVTEGCMKLALPEGLAVEDAVSLLSDVEGVAASQPNYSYHTLGETSITDTVQTSTAAALAAARVPEEATLLTQAAANDPGRSSQWALSSMNVSAAWDEVVELGASNESVGVAILDSGFLVSHEDLKDVVAATYNAVNGGSDVYGTASNATHGTHVAGIIAAQANNGKGVAGVAYSTASFATCKLIPIQVANNRGVIYTDTLVSAYSWLRKRKADCNIRVVNVSLGGDRDASKTSSDVLLERSINAAWNDGIVTVAAAGNISDGRYYTPFSMWPSDSPNVVSVMNLVQSPNADGVARASSSNFNVAGKVCKDISAPGSSILSTYSTSPSAYEYQSGTSMASPAVAGVLALEFKANPKLMAAEATSKLFSTAKDLTATSGASKGWDRVTGYGEVNAAAAVSTTAAYLSGATSVSVGRRIQLNVKINGEKQAAGSWRWSSSNTSIARVSSTGRVTGVSAGDVVISATNGSRTAYQTVTVSTLSVSSLSISVSSRSYTGQALKPNPVVRNGSVKLVKGRDYKVSYSNNKNVGKATVKVTGIGSYYGSTTVRFTIKPKATSITSLKRLSRGFSAQWKKRTAQTTGYQLQIARNKAFTKEVRKLRKANTAAFSAVVKNLAKSKRYYVRVRTYKTSGNTTYYSSWSKIKSVKTR